MLPVANNVTCGDIKAPSKLLSPVDGRLADQRVVQDGSWNKLVADAVLEGAVDLRPTSVGVEQLEHLHLSLPVHVQLRHAAVDPHQDAAAVLRDPQEAADQLVGQPFREGLEGADR